MEGRRSWRRIGTTLLVVAQFKDIIFGLALLQHTLQTESHNTYRNPDWGPNTYTYYTAIPWFCGKRPIFLSA